MPATITKAKTNEEANRIITESTSEKMKSKDTDQNTKVVNGVEILDETAENTIYNLIIMPKEEIDKDKTDE